MVLFGVKIYFFSSQRSRIFFCDIIFFYKINIFLRHNVLRDKFYVCAWRKKFCLWNEQKKYSVSTLCLKKFFKQICRNAPPPFKLNGCSLIPFRWDSTNRTYLPINALAGDVTDKSMVFSFTSKSVADHLADMSDDFSLVVKLTGMRITVPLLSEGLEPGDRNN